MAEAAKKVTIIPRPQRLWVRPIIIAFFFAILTGAIAVNRVYLGGSFLVEMFAAVFSVIVLVKMAEISVGKDVTMTIAEAKIWMDEGAPLDVKEWRAARAARVVGSSGGRS